MTDTTALKTVISDSGIKYGSICDKLKMSRTTLRSKIENKSEFTASEITKLSAILGIDISMRNGIFFADEGEFNSPFDTQ